MASHAQKHFIRQSSLTKRKRRSSLFDITGEGAEMSVRPRPAVSRQADSQKYLAKKCIVLNWFTAAVAVGDWSDDGALRWWQRKLGRNVSHAWAVGHGDAAAARDALRHGWRDATRCGTHLRCIG